ncbi:3-oxoadipate CoA-transferase subunit B [compost metagenome]
MVITDLAVLDFSGANKAMRVRSLHPGVTFDEVQDKTGFALARPETIPETAAPTAEQLAIIRDRLDPHNLRATLFKGDPAGDRRLQDAA